MSISPEHHEKRARHAHGVKIKIHCKTPKVRKKARQVLLNIIMRNGLVTRTGSNTVQNNGRRRVIQVLMNIMRRNGLVTRTGHGVKIQCKTPKAGVSSSHEHHEKRARHAHGVK